MKFGPERRIRKRPEYLSIQSAGQRVPTKHFILIVSKAPTGSSLPRLGITASKRVGNSVRRSRLKRLVRETFQQLEGYLPPGYDLVVICRRDNAEICQEWVVREWRGAEKRVKKTIATFAVELSP